MKTEINKSNLCIFHSNLIYKSVYFHEYESYLDKNISNIEIALNQAQKDALAELLGALSNPAAERKELIHQFERDQPHLFRRLYGDLITFVYSAPETAERVRRLADQGPREHLSSFDPSLLDAVITTQAGKRRL